MVDINRLADDSSKVIQEIAESYDFNVTDALEEMSTLANESDDWRKHLPYQAAISYFDDNLVRIKFIGHVDSCNYCQALLDSLHAPNESFSAFKQKIKDDALFEPVSNQTSANWHWLKHPIAAAFTIIAAFIVIPITLDSFNPSLDIISNLENKSETARIINLLANDHQILTKLENLDDPSSKFQAARFYLAADQYNTAYKLIGEGLEQSGIDKETVDMISYAAKINTADSSRALENAAMELHDLSKKSRLSSEETLRMSTLQARLGLHENALKNLTIYLGKIYKPNVATTLTASITETPL